MVLADCPNHGPLEGIARRDKIRATTENEKFVARGISSAHGGDEFILGSGLDVRRDFPADTQGREIRKLHASFTTARHFVRTF